MSSRRAQVHGVRAPIQKIFKKMHSIEWCTLINYKHELLYTSGEWYKKTETCTAVQTLPTSIYSEKPRRSLTTRVTIFRSKDGFIRSVGGARNMRTFQTVCSIFLSCKRRCTWGREWVALGKGNIRWPPVARGIGQTWSLSIRTLVSLPLRESSSWSRSLAKKIMNIWPTSQISWTLRTSWLRPVPVQITINVE